MIQNNQDNNNEINVPNQAFTHSGKFHSDDVFSGALLTYLNPNVEIIRGYNVPEDFEGIVFDIGGGQFDHHQQGAQVRDNGIPYAAFGLLWKEFATLILSEDDAKNFDKSFVEPLDYSDNTGAKNEIAEIISLFNPNWDEDVDSDTCFHQAKDVALQIITNKIKQIKSINNAKDFVNEAIDNAEDRIMTLSTRAPWKNFVLGTDIEFVVYPSDRGGYSAQGVPITIGTTELKIAFPEAWRGKNPDELKSISGVKTLSFCHNSGFLITAGTLDDTIKACKVAQNSNK